MTTMTAPSGKAGFASQMSEARFAGKPFARKLFAETHIAEPTFSCTRGRQIRRQILGVELFATVALAVCLVIAATAVSIGVARAHALPSFGTFTADAPMADTVFFDVMAAGANGLGAVVAHAQSTIFE
jgi:hypothetical protein